MKRFVFRLQVVLDRAYQEEEDELLSLAHLRRELTAKEQEIAAITSRRKQLHEHIVRLQCAAFDPREAHICHLQLNALAGDATRLAAERDEIERRVAVQQEKLIEAMRKRQTLEKLREKQLEDYNRDVAQYELKTMEECVLPRLARERSAEQARLQNLAHNQTTR